MKKTMKKITAVAAAVVMTMGMGTSVWAGGGDSAGGSGTTVKTTDKGNVKVGEESGYIAGVAAGFNGQLAAGDDSSTVTLVKKFVNVNAGEKTPAEDFAFTIENYGLWNVGTGTDGTTAAYTKDTMPTPTIANNKVAVAEGTSTDANAITTGTSTITIPEYSAIGDYWYKLIEKTGSTAGVVYSTNDSKTNVEANANMDHDGVYYLHVQVTEGSTVAGTSTKVRTATLHQTPPMDIINDNTQPVASGDDAAYNDATGYIDEDNNVYTTDGLGQQKVQYIENKYYAGDLEIKKIVTGNAGDKNRYFEVTVDFEAPTGKNVDSTIKYTAHAAAGDTASEKSLTFADGKAQAKFYVKDNETVTFTNIPYGVTYTIKETDGNTSGYENSMAYTEGKTAANTIFNGITATGDGESEDEDEDAPYTKYASGVILEAKDAVTITNKLNNIIDIGVVTNNAPYLALLAIAGAAVVVVLRKKRTSDVED